HVVWKWVRGLFERGEDDADDAAQTAAPTGPESTATVAAPTTSRAIEATVSELIAPLDVSGRPDPTLLRPLLDGVSDAGAKLEMLADTDPAAAIRVLRRYHVDFPDDVGLIWRLGRLYASRRERDAARVLLERLSNH